MPSPLLRLCRSNGAAFPFARALFGAFLCLGCLVIEARAQTSTAYDALPNPVLTLVGEYQIPSGLKLGGVEFGGVSALEYDPETGRYWALSDDRAERGPARVYILDIAIDDGVKAVDIVDMIEMTDASGAAYAPKSLDPEALRRAPDGGFYWAHERDAEGMPFVGEMDAAGKATRSYALPFYYAPSDGEGVRVNLGFESLTVDADGRVIVATEQALRQDGPETSLEGGALARVMVFDPASAEPVAEYAYPVGPVAALAYPTSGFKTNGLVELLALPGGGFLAMERSFSVGQGNVVKLFVTDFGVASDVSGSASFVDFPPGEVMAKKLVLTLQAGGIVDRVDNLEAMTFGPKIDGKPTLVLMSDNNFNPNGQFTQILVFTIE